MARTTSTNVIAILISDKQYDSSIALDAFIDTATALVDRVVTCAAEKGITHSSTELELIERWLAAHFYLHADQPFKSNKTGDASAVYQGEFGKSLKSTRYGQTALTLDHSGCLKSLSKGKTVARFIWGGLPPSEQTDYVDRD